jgi:hypothetical protein
VANPVTLNSFSIIITIITTIITIISKNVNFDNNYTVKFELYQLTELPCRELKNRNRNLIQMLSTLHSV